MDIFNRAYFITNGLYKSYLYRPLVYPPLMGLIFRAIHYGYCVSAKGLEPLTNGLKGHCSTIELRARNEIEILSSSSGCVNKFGLIRLNKSWSGRFTPLLKTVDNS